MKLIVACDINGGIGYKNKLPWEKITGDLPRFKSLTSDSVVLMGRNTWDSLPKKPLPNRLNVVLTSKPLEVPGAITISNLGPVKHYKNVWLIGGASVIDMCWDYIDEVYLTRTFSEYTCDTFISLVKLERLYMCVSREIHEDHTYEIWKKNETVS